MKEHLLNISSRIKLQKIKYRNKKALFIIKLLIKRYDKIEKNPGDNVIYLKKTKDTNLLDMKFLEEATEKHTAKIKFDLTTLKHTINKEKYKLNLDYFDDNKFDKSTQVINEKYMSYQQVNKTVELAIVDLLNGYNEYIFKNMDKLLIMYNNKNVSLSDVQEIEKLTKINMLKISLYSPLIENLDMLLEVLNPDYKKFNVNVSKNKLIKK